MRTINSLDDARIVISQLTDRLEKLETKNIDFHRRRITNASPSVDSHDYVIQSEVEDLINQFIKDLTVNFNPGEELVLRGLRPRVRLVKSGVTAQSRFAQFTSDATYLTWNLSYDGTNWNLDDVGLQGIAIKLPSTTNLLEINFAQAGANPRTLFTAFEIGNLGGVIAKDLTVYDNIGATGGNNTTTVIHKAGSAQGASPVLEVQNNGGTGVFNVLKDGEAKCISGAVNATPPSATTRPGEWVINTWLGVGTGTRTTGYAVDINGKVSFNNDLNLSNLTASRAAYLDANKLVKTSATTDTELGYLSGVTSAIQTQLAGKMATGGSTAHTIPLAKLTTLGANGSITWDVDGRVTAWVDPT